MALSEDQQMLDKAYNDIIETSKTLPEQGTPDWDKARCDGLGGSEMKVIKRGKDSFGTTIADIYRRKLGIANPINDTIVLLQGHIFEDITKHYIKLRYKINIVNINGPFKSRCNDIGYSMDGLARVRHTILRQLELFEDHSTGIPERECLIIFEFKSAYTRQLNKVPDYTDQVYTGLYTFPLVDFCVFTDTCYKICSVSQLYEHRAYARQLYDMYNTGHKVTHDPIAYSITFFTIDANADEPDDYGDLGLTSMDIVTYVFGMFRRGICEMHNDRIFIYDNTSNTQNYTTYIRSHINTICEAFKAKGRHVVAYMPWKLYKINFVLYSARDSEITPFLPRIEHFMKLVRTYKDASQEEKERSVKLLELL